MVKIRYSFDLSKLNTLRLTSQAQAYLALKTTDQLSYINMDLLRAYHGFFILGGGSNLVLPPFYNGLVIHNKLLGRFISHDANKQFKLASAMAGENWDSFVAWCCDNEAYGLENLSLIPGTVGAAPIQNIGAYGVEVRNFIESVIVYDLFTSQMVTFSNLECKFSYRNSFFKNNPRYIVVRVCFKLPTTPQLNTKYSDIAKQLSSIKDPTPHDLRKCIISTRQNRLPDPNEIGNVGSFFHNPVIAAKEAQALVKQYPDLPTYPTDDANLTKLPAGWLIDNLGLKGYRQGNVGVYTKQALILVNYEPASQKEILELAHFIQDQVKTAYNIQLNIEPTVIKPIDL